MNAAITQDVTDILVQGGFVMPPLILLSIILFTTLFQLVIELILAFRSPHPGLPRSDSAADSPPSAINLDTLFQQRVEWRLHFDRRLKFARILATTAPLLGLLGTVAGMLKTFTGLGLSEGLQTIDLIAAGISEALITTEAGLSIAIVGLILLWGLRAVRRRLLHRFETREAAFVLSQWNPDSPC